MYEENGNSNKFIQVLYFLYISVPIKPLVPKVMQCYAEKAECHLKL